MIKVLITGPESSGKSFLAQHLAQHFKTDFVPEFARQYLEHRNNYTQKDLSNIALGQVKMESSKRYQDLKLLFCDTGPEVIKIWSEVKYNSVDPIIEELFQNHKYNLILLCKPNITWEYDPLRENKENREELFLMYKTLLATQQTPVVEINQTQEKRLNQAIETINQFCSLGK